jgi:hypothetical protein
MHLGYVEPEESDASDEDPFANCSDVSDSEEADSCEEMVSCEEDPFADCRDSDSLADSEA